ncbi:uncharacterized protein BX664DRAFT_386412 [Halteromyces radiatus]|uniref:uncharacterized protein n=1 Tax=Halteromyces radiatus TaxID=101107 RepID=UPI00221EA4A6|nr:uncharacterized protein BX664DRAFT_386412 [Halteromyces radiatus]KAI8090019.1 hypothetical protein BX664DRAFT_386412 [Halteromyces radiatus]
MVLFIQYRKDVDRESYDEVCGMGKKSKVNNKVVVDNTYLVENNKMSRKNGKVPDKPKHRIKQHFLKGENDDVHRCHYRHYHFVGHGVEEVHYLKNVMSSPPTTLPSIQYLLSQQNSEDKKFTRGHRSTRSVSSLPSELQNLSLDGPSFQPAPVIPSKDDSHIIQPRPSWMTGPSPPPAIILPNTPQHNVDHHHHHHQRSISDLSLTTPSSSSSSSSYHTNHLHTHSPSIDHHHHQQRQRHLSHRRAISANTVDHMIHSSSSSNVPPVPPLPFYHRAHSNSPPEEHLSLKTTKPEPLAPFIEQPRNKLDNVISSTTPVPTPSLSSTSSSSNTMTPTETPIKYTTGSHTTVNGMDLPRDLATGRYLCPYCQKAFSRPSSLRIHTYSHTGEKPFECTECPRKFSVQSNMRRHLRIHLVRPSNRNTFS